MRGCHRLACTTLSNPGCALDLITRSPFICYFIFYLLFLKYVNIVSIVHLQAAPYKTFGAETLLENCNVLKDIATFSILSEAVKQPPFFVAATVVFLKDSSFVVRHTFHYLLLKELT